MALAKIRNILADEDPSPWDKDVTPFQKKRVKITKKVIRRIPVSNSSNGARYVWLLVAVRLSYYSGDSHNSAEDASSVDNSPATSSHSFPQLPPIDLNSSAIPVSY